MPHLKTAFQEYRDDPQVAFLLVSIDQDERRLERYLDQMRFPFPVVRLALGEAERRMGFDNVPSTFYVDRDGVVRYHVVGPETHGDSPNRVAWYLEQLKE